jgi:hypothetical protein
VFKVVRYPHPYNRYLQLKQQKLDLKFTFTITIKTKSLLLPNIFFIPLSNQIKLLP